MNLVPTFGVSAPERSVPEGTDSTIVRHYAAKLLRKAPVMVRVIDSHPELSGKFSTISRIGYQIQIARLKIR
ncbi:hypothetical protein TNCV_4051911 [Trichonephila clavipes]|nr:hypothetical protein TNCV_4051911 [Trichonephila clavipes]